MGVLSSLKQDDDIIGTTQLCKGRCGLARVGGPKSGCRLGCVSGVPIRDQNTSPLGRRAV